MSDDTPTQRLPETSGCRRTGRGAQEVARPPVHPDRRRRSDADRAHRAARDPAQRRRTGTVRRPHRRASDDHERRPRATPPRRRIRPARRPTPTPTPPPAATRHRRRRTPRPVRIVQLDGVSATCPDPGPDDEIRRRITFNYNSKNAQSVWFVFGNRGRRRLRAFEMPLQRQPDRRLRRRTIRSTTRAVGASARSTRHRRRQQRPARQPHLHHHRQRNTDTRLRRRR